MTRDPPVRMEVMGMTFEAEELSKSEFETSRGVNDIYCLKLDRGIEPSSRIPVSLMTNESGLGRL